MFCFPPDTLYNGNYMQSIVCKHNLQDRRRLHKIKNIHRICVPILKRKHFRQKPRTQDHKENIWMSFNLQEKTDQRIWEGRRDLFSFFPSRAQEKCLCPSVFGLQLTKSKEVVKVRSYSASGLDCLGKTTPVFPEDANWRVSDMLLHQNLQLLKSWLHIPG